MCSRHWDKLVLVQSSIMDIIVCYFISSYNGYMSTSTSWYYTWRTVTEETHYEHSQDHQLAEGRLWYPLDQAGW